MVAKLCEEVSCEQGSGDSREAGGGSLWTRFHRSRLNLILETLGLGPGPDEDQKVERVLSCTAMSQMCP